MGRSLKKGPFVDDHLMVKIEKLNETETIKNQLYEYHGKFTNLVLDNLSTHDKKAYIPKKDFYID